MDADTQVAPGVHRIDTPLGERVSSLYLFVGSHRSLLFDSGVAGTIRTYVVPFLAGLGLPPQHVEQVVVSHCDVDHCGGIAEVSEQLPAARVVAHRLDADAMETLRAFEDERSRSFREVFGFDETPEGVEWMRSVAGFGPVDERIGGAVEVDLGDRVIRILHTPGHSHGHLSVHDPDTGVLAISDAILGDAVPLANGDPSFPPTYRYEREYLATIEQVRALAPEHLATAHYGIFSGPEIADFLNTSRDFAIALRQAVLDFVTSAGAGVSLADLLVSLNPVVGSWPEEGTVTALAFPVVGHIEALIEDGLLSLVPGVDGALIQRVS